ncbi:MAG: hypothetical protein HYS27_05585 [Deltaproteobacteria bacterium]|nr:hypothetical protein [Deltaproteobacteria bacterium]
MADLAREMAEAEQLLAAGDTAAAIAKLEALVAEHRDLWPARANLVIIHRALAEAGAAFSWTTVLHHGDEIARTRPDLSYGHFAAARGHAGWAASLDARGQTEAARLARHEALAAIEHGLLATDVDDGADRAWALAAREALQRAVAGPAEDGPPSDRKARAEYLRLGLVIELLPLQRAAEWIDVELGVPEGGSAMMDLVMAAASRARELLLERLAAVPGRCTPGVAARAWLGHLAIGQDDGSYSGADVAMYLRRVLDAKALVTADAPALLEALRAVETGPLQHMQAAIAGLRRALEPFVPVARSFLQTGQLEPPA